MFRKRRERKRELNAFMEAVAGTFREMYESAKLRGRDDPHSVLIVGTMGDLSVTTIAAYGGWIGETDLEDRFAPAEADWLGRLEQRLVKEHHGIDEGLRGVTAAMVLHWSHLLDSSTSRAAVEAMPELLELSPRMQELVTSETDPEVIAGLLLPEEAGLPHDTSEEEYEWYLGSRARSLWALTEAVLDERPDLSSDVALAPWMRAVLSGESGSRKFIEVQSLRLGVDMQDLFD